MGTESLQMVGGHSTEQNGACRPAEAVPINDTCNIEQFHCVTGSTVEELMVESIDLYNNNNNNNNICYSTSATCFDLLDKLQG